MQDKTDNCKGLTGWLFGHKFYPRYDESSSTTTPGNFSSVGIPDTVLSQAVEEEYLCDIIAAANGDSSKRTYVHDVCVRCGKVIKREQA